MEEKRREIGVVALEEGENHENVGERVERK